jgi:hypothetical protein
LSISKIQKDRKIKQFAQELAQKGVEPNNYEINILLREYFDNHTMGMPYYSPIKQKPYEESSKDDYNHNFLTFKEDIETAYEANIEANNKAVSIQEYYDSEKSKVFHAIDKIALRINCLQDSLRSNKRIQEYVEVFDNLYNLELYGDESRNIPYTTSFIDLLQKKVCNEKVNSQINKLSIINSNISITGLDNFGGYSSKGELSKILNDTINDVFIFIGQSENNQPKSVNLIIDLTKLMKFNTVMIKSTSSNDMTFTLALSDDGNNFYTVYDINGKDMIEWNFETKNSRYIKITCTKNEADGEAINTQGLNVYEYYYIFKNISIALETFESHSIMVTKPIEFNNLTNFIKLDANDMVYSNTRIDYFIGFDNGTDKIGWDAIPNHKEHGLFMFEKKHNIANIGTYSGYGEQSALTGLYQVFKLPTGVNTNSLKVTPGYNMWSVQRYTRDDVQNGDYDDGFHLKEDDVTDFIKNCKCTQLFMDCENYTDFEINSNTLYILTQYVDAPQSISIYDKFLKIIDSGVKVVSNDASIINTNPKDKSTVRLFVNGYEQVSGDNNLYSINLKKGVNKIQIAIYNFSSYVIKDKLYHNLNFKEVTNDVFAFKPMQYTNIGMLTKSLEPTYEYYTIKNNIIYVNVPPYDLINSPNKDMGYFITYYGLKQDMQRYFTSNKLRFRIMASLTSKSKNVSPSILNFRITGK